MSSNTLRWDVRFTEAEVFAVLRPFLSEDEARKEAGELATPRETCSFCFRSSPRRLGSRWTSTASCGVGENR